MIQFEKLGFRNFNNYVEYFFNTLLVSNKTYEYFVDWKEVKGDINKYLNEISLFNSLTKLEPYQREGHLRELLQKYPQIAEIIPMLIAVRVKKEKIDIFDPEVEDFMTFDFRKSNINETAIPRIIDFCYKIGIIELFDEIKDIYDYLLGVEVGLDSNARKNRSGIIFEGMTQKKVKKLLLGASYRVVENDRNFSLYPSIRRRESGGKTHDIVVYKNERPVLIVECNFYNVAGSKPISIAESYLEMYRVAKEHDIEFLWVTDGSAWHKMKEPLFRAMEEIEWIFNFRMLNSIGKILESP
jgi:type II restriction enzyme